MTRSVRYTGGQLDRAGAMRQDAAWVTAMRAHRAARVVPVWRDRNLVVGVNGTSGGVGEGNERTGRAEMPRVGWCTGEAYAQLAADDAIPWALLGLDQEGPVFAADVSEADEERLAAVAAGGTFVDLRQVGPMLDAPQAALLAYARGILGWHRRSQYCGVCGAPTASHHAGHMRRCADARCATEIYPRTDPAVIMLVERIPADGGPRQCLLARHGRLPARAYSTLAGFVEPGESLEEAVAREVMEETGVRVSRVTYQSSQPWPFPASLMVGFRALAASEEITIDHVELEDARWFTAAEVAAFGEWEDESAQFRLPRRDSIARVLVDGWLEGIGGGG